MSETHDMIEKLLDQALAAGDKGLGIRGSGDVDGKPFTIAIGVGPASTLLDTLLDENGVKIDTESME